MTLLSACPNCHHCDSLPGLAPEVLCPLPAPPPGAAVLHPCSPLEESHPHSWVKLEGGQAAGTHLELHYHIIKLLIPATANEPAHVVFP